MASYIDADTTDFISIIYEVMKMTIDEHIEVLKSYHHGFTGCAGNLQDSIDVAVDIMQKYKKIEEIVMNGDDTHYSLLMQIKEVVEDGKDD